MVAAITSLAEFQQVINEDKVRAGRKRGAYWPVEFWLNRRRAARVAHSHRLLGR